MTVGSILLAVALLILVGLFILRPLLVAPAAAERLSERQALEAQKEVVLERIRALDFDHETEKVPEEEYEKRRGRLVAEAAHILQQLDKLAPVPATNGAAARVDDDIEAAIARLRGREDGDDVAEIDIEAAVAQVRRRSGNANDGQAPTRDAADKFCAYCGNHFA
jgi:hypothetical protein